MLIGDWWLCPGGISVPMGKSEHATFALNVMLNFKKEDQVPLSWFQKGVPEEELDRAEKRGADPKALKFLENQSADPRLYAIREYGWIRAAKQAFNLWEFDDETADVVRSNTDYWKSQTYMDPKYEMVNVYELKDGDKYSITISKFMDGGSPAVLRDLAMHRIDREEADRRLEPYYSTAKFSEMERRQLCKREGDNPRRRPRR